MFLISVFKLTPAEGLEKLDSPEFESEVGVWVHRRHFRWNLKRSQSQKFWNDVAAGVVFLQGLLSAVPTLVNRKECQ